MPFWADEAVRSAASRVPRRKCRPLALMPCGDVEAAPGTSIVSYSNVGVWRSMLGADGASVEAGRRGGIGTCSSDEADDGGRADSGPPLPSHSMNW
jgi:hypothetical protein